MNARRILLLAAALFALGGTVALPQATSTDALSQLSTPKQFDLSKLKCSDFLNASLTDRGFLVMLYFGWSAAKSGTTQFVTADVHARAMKLTDYCASAPNTLMFAAVSHVMGP